MSFKREADKSQKKWLMLSFAGLRPQEPSIRRAATSHSQYVKRYHSAVASSGGGGRFTFNPRLLLPSTILSQSIIGSRIPTSFRHLSTSSASKSNDPSSQSLSVSDYHQHSNSRFHPPSPYNTTSRYSAFNRRTRDLLLPKPQMTWDRDSSVDEDDPWLLMAKNCDDLAEIMDEDVAMALSAGQDQLDKIFESALTDLTPTRVDQDQPRVSIRDGLERFDWRLQAPSRIGETNRPPAGSRRFSLLNRASNEQSDPISNGQWSINCFNRDLQSRIVSRTLPSKELLKGSFTAAQRKKGLTLSELPVLTSSTAQTSPSARFDTASQHTQDRLSLLTRSKEYRARWSDIMSHEKAAAEAAIEARRQWPIDKLVQSGYAIDGLLAYWHGASSRHFGNRVATFKMIGSQPLPWNRFRPGDAVEVESEEMRLQSNRRSRERDQRDEVQTSSAEDEAANGTLEATPKKDHLRATILEKGPRHIKLYFEGESQKTDLEASASWRLHQLHNDIAEVRMQEAFQSLDHDIEFLERAKVPGKELVLAGSRISDILLDIQPPAERDTRNCFEGDMRIKSWMDRYSRDDPLIIEGDPDLGLNQSQTKAVAMMLKERVSLVQGPPGTGKTRTLVSTVQLLKLHFQVPQPILLTSHTNVAVDNLADGCRTAGLKVVRVGPSARVRPSLINVTLDAHMARHPRKAKLDETKAEIEKLEKEIARGDWKVKSESKSTLVLSTTSLEEDLEEEGEPAEQQISSSSTRSNENLARLKSKLRQLRGRKYVLSKIIVGEILQGADVIAATAISSGSPGLRMIDFPIVFFDEGSMSTEPISLIPLTKGCRQLAIIGDHKQLPPVVISPESRSKGLSKSLFERLIQRSDIPSVMLDEQHRMHPSLSSFPNQAFYDNALKDGRQTWELACLKSSFLPTSSSLNAESQPSANLIFVNHEGSETLLDKSLANSPEVDLVSRIIIDLLSRNPGLTGSAIGIVTPYMAQVRRFQRLLKRDNPSRRYLESILHGQGFGSKALELSEIEIHTVDGFEGREKSVILFSTVRSNQGGFVGFLSDRRRLNVALTRAKQTLFVIGNLETLKKAALSEKGQQNVEQPDIESIRSYAEMLEQKGRVVNGTEVVKFLDGEQGEGEIETEAHEEVEEFDDSDPVEAWSELR